MPDIVFTGEPSTLATVLDRITGDLSDLLDLVGQRVKESSVEAFRRGGLDTPWQTQYPNQQPGEFAHLAGALSDLNRGSFPKARRFQDKSPLIDTGTLSRSIAYQQVGASAVEVGTRVPYAATHQFGIKTTQPVTETARGTFARWLRTQLGKQFGDRIRHVLDSDVLETQVVARPFLGITKETEKRIRQDVEDYFAGEIGGPRGNP